MELKDNVSVKNSVSSRQRRKNILNWIEFIASQKSQKLQITLNKDTKKLI